MEAILGFEPIGIIAGICRKPHYIWGYTKEGVKVCKKYPTIPDPNYPDSFGMSPEDKLVVRDTPEEVMAHFENEGFQMPEEDVWDFPERSIRVSVKDSSLLSMLKAYPELISFLDTLKDFIVSRNGEQVIYLNELYDQHRQLFQSFGANIETYAN